MMFYWRAFLANRLALSAISRVLEIQGGPCFFDIERILRKKQPQAFLLENVRQLVSHDKGRTFLVIRERLKELGYTIYYKVLNALDFGLPQKRERIFIVGFREQIVFDFPMGNGKYRPLSEILEPDDEVDVSFFASERIQRSRLKKCKIEPFYPSVWHENKGGNISILPFSCALRAGASYNYLLVNGIRRFSGRELLRLQGFPEDFKIVVNITQLRKQTGKQRRGSSDSCYCGENAGSLTATQIKHLSLTLPMVDDIASDITADRINYCLQRNVRGKFSFLYCSNSEVLAKFRV